MHYLRQSKSLLSALLLVSGTISSSVVADDLLIIEERSKGISVSGGDNNLSTTESVSVAAKGRLWAVKQQASASYNVICMNQSAESVSLSQSDTAPWLQTVKGSCTEKAANVFSCNNAQQQPALMCRTQAVVGQSGGSGITDMTAVALRSLDNSDEAFYRIANSVMEWHKP